MDVTGAPEEDPDEGVARLLVVEIPRGAVLLPAVLDLLSAALDCSATCRTAASSLGFKEKRLRAVAGGHKEIQAIKRRQISFKISTLSRIINIWIISSDFKGTPHL